MGFHHHVLYGSFYLLHDEQGQFLLTVPGWYIYIQYIQLRTLLPCSHTDADLVKKITNVKENS